MRLSPWIILSSFFAFCISSITVEPSVDEKAMSESIQAKSSELVAWSREFFKLLDVDLPLGQNWDKELSPVVAFVEAKKMIGNNIAAAYVNLSPDLDPVQLVNRTSGLGIFSGQSLNFVGHEMSMDRFKKMLYNAKRGRLRPTTTLAPLSITPGIQLVPEVQLGTTSIPILLSPTNLLSSPSNVEVIRTLLQDLFQLFRQENLASTTTSTTPSTAQTTTWYASTTTTTTTITTPVEGNVSSKTLYSSTSTSPTTTLGASLTTTLAASASLNSSATSLDSATPNKTTLNSLTTLASAPPNTPTTFYSPNSSSSTTATNSTTLTTTTLNSSAITSDLIQNDVDFLSLASFMDMSNVSDLKNSSESFLEEYDDIIGRNFTTSNLKIAFYSTESTISKNLHSDMMGSNKTSNPDAFNSSETVSDSTTKAFDDTQSTFDNFETNLNATTPTLSDGFTTNMPTIQTNKSVEMSSIQTYKSVEMSTIQTNKSVEMSRIQTSKPGLVDVETSTVMSTANYSSVENFTAGFLNFSSKGRKDSGSLQTMTKSTTALSTVAPTTATTLSLEDRVAALFPEQSSKVSNKSNSTAKFLPTKSKTWLAKKRSTTPKTTTTTTPYQKYPTKTSLAKLATVKPDSTPLSSIWAESDVKECKSGRSCVFRGRIFVTGFNAHLQKDWSELSPKLVSRMRSALQQIIADTHVGSSRDRVRVQNVLPTSTTSAEVTVDVKLVELALPVSSKTLTDLVNAASNKYTEPYLIEHAFTEFHLVNPEAPAKTYVARITSSPAVDQTMSLGTIAAIMATIVIGGPSLLWLLLRLIRRLRLRNLRQKVKDTKPLVYRELDVAFSSLKTNNLYSAVGKKANTKSRVSFFDVEREKERAYIELKTLQRNQASGSTDDPGAAASAADRPLPPVPDPLDSSPVTASPGSPLVSFQKTTRFVSGQFGSKKSVRFNTLLSGSPNDSLSRLSRRGSSIRRLTQLTQSLRLRRHRIKLRTPSTRPSIAGFFNEAFVDDVVAHSEATCEVVTSAAAAAADVHEEYFYTTDEAQQHDYEVIGFNKCKTESSKNLVHENIDQPDTSFEVTDCLEEHIYGTV